MSESIHLGFEVGTGEPVTLPLRHMAITGMTQEAGKTTALEALVNRAKVTALAFVTKRGESSFTARQWITQPYFRDRADWQFVTSIIDATLQEKNKFLRPWIMRVCRTTKTLADVQRAVRTALQTAKGMNEGVYTQLDAYLDLIVPEIARMPLAPTLVLNKGLNIMDVSASPLPMQMLFIQSALDWINENGDDTVVVIPEAWEFVPEGAGSPVKASAIALARKGASVGNRIWIDSQDMAGVDKTILRACAVWLIGVQREANEIKRNLSNIPANVKRPSAADVATLEKGQFFACWGRNCIKVYAQPIWLNDADAIKVAKGRLAVTTFTASKPKEKTVTPLEAETLRTENANLKREVETLKAIVRRLERNAETPPVVATPPVASKPAAPVIIAHDMPSMDAIYDVLKARLAQEAPALIAVLTERSEIEVRVAKRVIEANGDSLRGQMALLIKDGFFDEGATGSAAYTELVKRGMRIAKPGVYKEADNLTALGFLRKESDGYRAVDGMKINVKAA